MGVRIFELVMKGSFLSGVAFEISFVAHAYEEQCRCVCHVVCCLIYIFPWGT
jgi:hypothetical protein